MKFIWQLLMRQVRTLSAAVAKMCKYVQVMIFGSITHISHQL